MVIESVQDPCGTDLEELKAKKRKHRQTEEPEGEGEGEERWQARHKGEEDCLPGRVLVCV